MKYALGNAKLGDGCYIVSRPVGDTCPSDCFFLGNGCYAEHTEKQYKQTRTFAFNNVDVTERQVKVLIQDAINTGRSIRLHERGDFLLNGKIDRKYINAWDSALSHFHNLPNIWLYTHAYSRHISNIGRKYPKVHCYASVHNQQDYKKAKRAGFKLFAWIVKDKKKKGGSKEYPKRVELPVLGDTLVCPEQRKGRNFVTCTGGNGTVACKFCVKGLNNIVFLTH